MTEPLRGQMNVYDCIDQVRSELARTCPMTGEQHRLVWFRAAYFCRDCRQKIETCCEGQ